MSSEGVSQTVSGKALRAGLLLASVGVRRCLPRLIMLYCWPCCPEQLLLVRRDDVGLLRWTCIESRSLCSAFV